MTLELYGRKDPVRLVQTVARWHGLPQRPLKIVVVEPLRGGRPMQAFYSADVAQSAEQVLTGYSGRWSIEEAFQAPQKQERQNLLLLLPDTLRVVAA